MLVVRGIPLIPSVVDNPSWIEYLLSHSLFCYWCNRWGEVGLRRHKSVFNQFKQVVVRCLSKTVFRKRKQDYVLSWYKVYHQHRRIIRNISWKHLNQTIVGIRILLCKQKYCGLNKIVFFHLGYTRELLLIDILCLGKWLQQ